MVMRSPSEWRSSSAISATRSLGSMGRSSSGLAPREREQLPGERRPRGRSCGGSSRDSGRSSGCGPCRCRTSRELRMTCSRLLKSCATPPASRPSASIFCACASAAASSALRGRLASASCVASALIRGGDARGAPHAAVSAPPMRQSSAPPAIAASAVGADVGCRIERQPQHRAFQRQRRGERQRQTNIQPEPRAASASAHRLHDASTTGARDPRRWTGKRRQVTYLNSNVTCVASCRPLASVASATTHDNTRQLVCASTCDLPLSTCSSVQCDAAPQQPEMLRPSELAPVERQPAGIARLRAPDDNRAAVRQRVVGKPHGGAAERLRHGALEIRAAAPWWMVMTAGAPRRLRPRSGSAGSAARASPNSAFLE